MKMFAFSVTSSASMISKVTVEAETEEEAREKLTEGDIFEEIDTDVISIEYDGESAELFSVEDLDDE